MTNIPPTALIIEGDKTLCDLLSLALRRIGFEVISSADGTEIVDLFLIHKPELLLLGLILPNRNGLEIMRELRRKGHLKNTTVFLVTALGYREIVRQAIKAGADDFLIKPIDIDLLIRKVQRIFPNNIPGSPRTSIKSYTFAPSELN